MPRRYRLWSSRGSSGRAGRVGSARGTGRTRAERTAEPNGGRVRLIPLGGLGEFGLNAMVLEWEGHLLPLDAGVHVPERRDAGRRLDRPRLPVPRRAARTAARHPAHPRPRGPHRRARLRAAGGAGARLRQPPHARLRARAGCASAASSADLRTLTPGAAGRDRPVPRAPDPRRAQRARQPRPRHRDAGRRRAGERRLQDRPAGRRPTSAPTSRRCRPGATAACSRCSPTARTSSSAAARGGEDDVLPAFEEVLARTRGRVLVSCFATSIPRIQRVADLARRRGPLASASSAAAWSTTPRWRWTSGLLRIPAVDAAAAAARSRDCPRRAALACSSRAARASRSPRCRMISVDEHRDVARGPGRHGRALRARRSPATSARSRA